MDIISVYNRVVLKKKISIKYAWNCYFQNRWPILLTKLRYTEKMVKLNISYEQDQVVSTFQYPLCN